MCEKSYMLDDMKTALENLIEQRVFFTLDMDEIILNKIKRNNEKYPVEKAKNSAKKYNEL